MAEADEVEEPTYRPSRISPYNYWAKVEAVVDGDTLDLTVDLGFSLTFKARFRLLGVNTPEMFGVKHDSAEYARGVAARERVLELIPEHGWVEVRTYIASREKYGRYLCEVFIDGESLAGSLIASGHGEATGTG